MIIMVVWEHNARSPGAHMSGLLLAELLQSYQGLGESELEASVLLKLHQVCTSTNSTPDLGY